jgi:hypothetical protein
MAALGYPTRVSASSPVAAMALQETCAQLQR